MSMWMVTTTTRERQFLLKCRISVPNASEMINASGLGITETDYSGHVNAG